MAWYNDKDDFKESVVPYLLILGTIAGAYAIGRGCSHKKTEQEPKKNIKNMTLGELVEGKEKWAKFVDEVIETQNENAEKYPEVFKHIPETETKIETVKIYIPGAPYPYREPSEWGPQDVPEYIPVKKKPDYIY